MRAGGISASAERHKHISLSNLAVGLIVFATEVSCLLQYLVVSPSERNQEVVSAGHRRDDLNAIGGFDILVK